MRAKQNSAAKGERARKLWHKAGLIVNFVVRTRMAAAVYHISEVARDAASGHRGMPSRAAPKAALRRADSRTRRHISLSGDVSGEGRACRGGEGGERGWGWGWGGGEGS